MIYTAIRNQNWGTLKANIPDENVAQDEDGFLVKNRKRITFI
jgi:hypothetical protein